MRLAFHKAGRSIFSRLIRLKTRSIYSHVELVFSDGISFSAREQDHPAVEFIHVRFLPGEWDFIDLDVTQNEEYAIRQRCRSQVGKSYDWLGILGFVLPFGEHDDDDLFCSEAVTRALQVIGYFPAIKPWTISPGKLYDLLWTKTSKH